MKLGNLTIGVMTIMAAWQASGTMPTQDEMSAATKWIEAKFSGEHAPSASQRPFSFRYNGKPSTDFLKTWKSDYQEKKLGAQYTQFVLTCSDPETGLLVRCEGRAYSDFPAVEWTLHFKNTGTADTPLLGSILPLNVTFERNGYEEFALHHFNGSPCTPTDYQPYTASLVPKAKKHIATEGGRGTNTALPYFNIEWPTEGVIAVLGWPGQWAADFARDEGRGLTLKAGQEFTHFVLHPGEEVRSPLAVLLFYKGDWIRAQNVWRSWMLAHNVPRPGGQIPKPHMAACSSHWYHEMINANEENQKMFVDRYLEEKLGLDYWWMDAGWYINQGDWPSTGTWEVDTRRFPNGLRAVSDHAHAKGVKIIVWFEPERVATGTWLYEKRPEWLLGKDGEQKLLNLGNPEALKWTIEHFDKLIVEQGVDLYRQDHNIDPLGFWRANDTPDRQGITEIRHIEGYLAFWDELRRRHPNLLIDSCASGGRRNDLETMRRAVPHLRSDYILEPVAQQLHTYGLSFWIPIYGAGIREFDAYGFRSQMTPLLIACYDMREKGADYESLRRLLGQWRDINKYYVGDYYPLTPYHAETTQWMGWQFDRPDLGEGMVQMFRRPDSIYESARVFPRGLDAKATYVLSDLDQSPITEYTGAELMEKGLAVSIAKKPGSVVLVYKKKQ